MKIPEIVEVPVVERVPVPAALLEICAPPPLPTSPVWGDLLSLVSRYQIYQSCVEAHMKQLRHWNDGR